MISTENEPSAAASVVATSAQLVPLPGTRSAMTTGVPGKVDLPESFSDFPHGTVIADALIVTDPLSSTTIVPSLFGPPPVWR